MASDLRPGEPRTDRDGVKQIETGAGHALRGFLIAALALLGVGAWLVVRWTRPAAAGRAASVATDAQTAAVRETHPTPEPAKPAPLETSANQAPHVRRHEKAPDKQDKDAEPTFTLLQPGEKAGLGVFPPPGTKPIKRGIVVPDDYVLPEGYVRHYQTTDDGRRLPPILMFHPDYEGVDADGNRIPLPDDRIVPPEMVPPGLAVQMLDPDQAPTAAGRAR